MTENDFAVLAWNARMHGWVFEPGDPEADNILSDRATLGRDPIEAMAIAMPAEPVGAAAFVGTVTRTAFDRSHVFVIGFSQDQWTCWQFSGSPPADDNMIRHCSADTPQAAMLACFEALGGLNLDRIQ